jgi:glycosyltransferase involved in cell wall biosynthesis
LQFNQFSNQNVLSWWKWLLCQQESLPAVTFYFLSKKNSTSPRYFPLFNEMKSVRIVLMKGTNIGKLDFIQLKALNFIKNHTKFKQKKYLWIMNFDININKKFSTNVILNLDDPLYTSTESTNLLLWEQNLETQKRKGIIIVTSEKTKSYLVNTGLKSSIYIIHQGYLAMELLAKPKFNSFSCVYTSPYIDSLGDRNGSHPTWGVDLFIRKIIPKLIEIDPSIQIHLIGRCGKQTLKMIQRYSQVITHGLKSIDANNEIMHRCHIALYPRNIDNMRRVQKIYEYIGAGLPIVAFKLEDTKPVADFNIGEVVTNTENFIEAILRLKRNHKLYLEYFNNINKIKKSYSWEKIAAQYDKIVSLESSNII